MGTYRQPGLVLDKTLGMIPEAIEDMNSKIIKDVEANRARKLKEEQERIKKDLKEDEAKRIILKENAELKSKADQVPSIVDVNNQTIQDNEITLRDVGGNAIQYSLDPQSDNYLGGRPEYANMTQDQIAVAAEKIVGEGGIELSMKTDLTYLVNELGKHEKGSPERDFIVGQIKQMTEEIPVITSLVNNESIASKTAFKFDGSIIPNKAGIQGTLLFDGQPDFDVRAGMERDILFSTNQNRFTTLMPGQSPDGTSMLRYTDDNGKSVNISYKRYNKLLGQGGSLMGVTKAKPFDDMLKAVWSSRIKSHYNGVSKYSSENEKNGTSSVTKRQTIKSFDKANEVMKKEVALWVDGGGLNSTQGSIPGYNYAQNNWQMMGGPSDDPEMRIYKGTPEQNERAKMLMLESMKLAYGSETSISNYGVTETQLKEEKLTKIQSAARIVALEDGITLYPRGDGDDKTQQEANQKVKLKAINTALGKPEGNKKIDLEDIKTHWTELSKKPSTLAALLNSMSSSPDANNKLYYQGDTIAEELAIQLHGRKDVPLKAKVLDAFYVKGVGGWEAKDFLNGYDAFEMDILNALSKSKEYENIKKANLKKTGLKDIDVAEVVLPKSTEDEDRNFYRSQTT